MHHIAAMVPDDRMRIALLSARGNDRRRCGRLEEAAADQREAIALASALGDRELEARLHAEHGMTAYARCDFALALRSFREALDLQMSTGAGATQAITLTRLAMVHRERGELADARAAARRALALHGAANETARAATTLAELALCDLESGDLPGARAGLVAALEACGPAGSRATQAFVRGFLAVVAHAEGDLATAEEGYAAALQVCRDHGYARFEGGALGYSALVALERGDLERARDALALARELLARAGDRRHYALFSGWLAACARARSEVALAKTALDDARRAVPESDPMRTTVELTVALSDDAHPLPRLTAEHAKRSWDVRFALARVETRRALRPSPVPADLSARAAFLVEESGAWIERASGQRLRCDHRRATQRILGALARARLESPGRALTAAELVAVGWPGERILLAAAKNRLRVAVAWLRKNALGEALVSVGDGYLLDARAVGIAPTDAAAEDAPSNETVQRSEVRALIRGTSADLPPRAARRS